MLADNLRKAALVRRRGAGDEGLGSAARRLSNFLYVLLFLGRFAVKNPFEVDVMHRARTGPEFALQHKAVRIDRRFRAHCQSSAAN